MNCESDLIRIRRALLSVSDKSGLADLGRALADHGVDLLSTGGTARALSEAGLTVREVADHTGWPEMLDGRIKTLHPAIHGGILGRRDLPAHREAMDRHAIAPIDLVVVNLYPFERIRASGAGAGECIEGIDIGGPALIRSAAKNHDFTAILVDPSDYPAIIEELARQDGRLGRESRRRLAATAFARTAAYDAAIAGWMAEEAGEAFPRRLVLAGSAPQIMRYGENPHQRAALYRTADRRPGVAAARQLQGKPLSYNNLNDADAALELVAEFDEPAVAIVKHATPCGVALAGDLATAHARALACDPVSAFGGVVAVNRALDEAAARAIAGIFTEVVIAPSVDPAAAAILAARGNLRLLVTGAMPDPAAPGPSVRGLAGGILVQDRDAGRIAATDLRCVTRRAPDPEELRDLLTAFRICKHVRSNAIVHVRDGASVGIGAGQPSRVDAARLAADKARAAARAAGLAEIPTIGSAVASDAFFPFADGLLVAADAGARAVIQPGGSIRDEEVIAAADVRGLTMVFTGMRHFRH